MKVKDLLANVSPFARVRIIDPVKLFEGYPKDVPFWFDCCEVLNIGCQNNSLSILI